MQLRWLGVLCLLAVDLSSPSGIDAAASAFESTGVSYAHSQVKASPEEAGRIYINTSKDPGDGSNLSYL